MKVRHLGMTYVKCTRFLDVPSAQLAAYGIVGDREFVLVNERNELLASDQHAPFLSLHFEFSSDTNLLVLHYPDGHSFFDVLRLADRCEDVDYLGMRNISLRKVLGDWDNRLAEYSGRNVRLYRCERAGSGIDVKPITVVTTGSLRRLSDVLGAEVDHRRFRANLVIEHDQPHVEDSWEGSILAVGTAKLRVMSSVPRCVVTQLDPDTGNDNQRVVRALQSYRDRVRLPDGLLPQYATPGFASYAGVISPGKVEVGDTAFLTCP